MTTSKENLPDWLKGLQEESWELELLVSGGAIFSLFQFDHIFLEWFVSLQHQTTIPFFPTVGWTLMLAIKIITLGFCVHLISRTYWLALVCLNHAFPGGIKSQKIDWVEPYKASVKNEEGLHEDIIRADDFCGIVIFVSIVYFFITLGLTTLLFLLFIFLRASWLFDETGGLWILLLIPYLLYVQDVIGGDYWRRGPFKQSIPILHKIITYYTVPFFWLFDIVTLRFLYQKALFLFFTNVNKTKSTLGVCIALCLAGFWSYLSVHNEFGWHAPMEFILSVSRDN